MQPSEARGKACSYILYEKRVPIYCMKRREISRLAAWYILKRKQNNFMLDTYSFFKNGKFSI
jgi:hypothetical protein